MEAGSIPGAPPAVATPPAPQAPTPAAPDPASANPGALPQAPTPAVQPADPSGSDSQISAMTERAEAAEKKLAELEGGNTGSDGDLLSLLYGEPDPQGGLTPEEVNQLLADEGSQVEDPEAGQGDMEEFDKFVTERAQEVAQSLVDPILQERQDEQLNALTEKYPDITKPEIFEKVSETLQNFEKEFGEGARLSPRLVELAYQAVKAGEADAGAVPAEQAASHGASIETQAGQTQEEEPSLDEQYANALSGVSAGGSEFD